MRTFDGGSHEEREFLGLGAMSAIQLFALAGRGGWSSPAMAKTASEGFGALQSASDSLLLLPEGFTYVAIQRGGDAVTDGFAIPPQPDGMAILRGPTGNTSC